MAVGSNIKKRRYEMRMSQQELAEAMGYKTRSTIAKIEAGENDVSQKKLQKFANVLDTTVEALIFGYAKPNITATATEYTVSKKNKTAVVILAGGKTGKNSEHNHVIEYSLKLDSNPEFTASVIVAYARAVYRMNTAGDYGCKTVFDVPPALLSAKPYAELIKELL